MASSLSVEELRAVRERLLTASDGVDPDLALVLIRELEELKNTATAVQAELSVVVHDSQRAADQARGISADETARVVGAQLGLARRESPRLGTRFLGVARAVVIEMPHTAAALRAGTISEWQTTQVVAETAYLSQEHRGRVDEAIQGALGKATGRRLAGLARQTAYRLDPEAAVARRAKAERERRVWVRPAPDTMTWLTALLPVKDGITCLAALEAAANSAGHDPRGRGQLMADTLVERISGRRASCAPQATTPPAADEQTAAARAGDAPTPDVREGAWQVADTQAGTGNLDSERNPTSRNGSDVTGVPVVTVNLLVPIETLTGEAPADLEGFGPIPADLARQFLAEHEEAGGVIRRVFTAPDTGELIAMDSRARRFTGLLAAFVRLRDQTCRTPFCDAPIGQIDHIQRHADGGRTSASNAEGFCARCNYTKEHPDLRVSGNAAEQTTATRGLTETSKPPSPPGSLRPSACTMRRHTKRITTRLPEPATAA
ncbi:HNH endonuclease [Branchiibius hedensis]|uniref:HNH endonuclease n=1 Tax=Branchiibius hedensis TaxID=672460 RepID=A0A2Y8ZRU0_9MICO|nr:HNH endonuclease signature motif containing protein [Branchiibius hedensis]PWJ25792.1 HNH endonuclease [Branchiibius hedensis]SSA34605.1 HNH endonuclease [Branchiibius hedensis]